MNEFILNKYNNWNNLTGDLPLKLNLQQFAAEDEGRTEEPTEKKIREAREKGQVAKTPELPQAIVVIFGFMVIYIFSSFIFDTIAAITKYYLSNFSTLVVSKRNILNEFSAVFVESGKILVPIFFTAFVAAIAGNIFQVGLQFSTHPLKLDWSKIKVDPATMIKKIFFSKQVLMNLFKSLFKVLAIGFISYIIISNDFEKILITPDISIALALKLVLTTGFKIIIWSSILLLVLSVPDYFFQKMEFIESLKMTKHEIKEELKESMGDPYLRARLKEMQREIIMKSMISKEVPKADVIITNPTHISIALKYDLESMNAPTVIAKGEDALALKIREIAKENNITMIENKPLAWKIYELVEIGDIIPGELFAAVVAVYKQLYEKQQYSMA